MPQTANPKGASSCSPAPTLPLYQDYLLSLAQMGCFDPSGFKSEGFFPWGSSWWVQGSPSEVEVAENKAVPLPSPCRSPTPAPRLDQNPARISTYMDSSTKKGCTSKQEQSRQL